MKKFWMVMCDGQTETDRYRFLPHFRHETSESACREAERLAVACQTRKFFVLEAMDYCEVQTTKWTKMYPAKPMQVEGGPFF